VRALCPDPKGRRKEIRAPLADGGGRCVRLWPDPKGRRKEIRAPLADGGKCFGCFNFQPSYPPNAG